VSLRGQTRVALLGLLALVGLLAASSALADVQITRAELNGTGVRIEGTAIASRTITVNGVAMGTSDSAGNFRVESNSFAKPADCKVSVNDGSATPATATLSGCTVSSSTPPPSSTPTLSKVTVNPTDVVGGTSSTGTVTLTSAAPAGGFQVALTSDNPVAATVPPSVTVAAGSTSASFTITTNPIGNPQSSLIIGTAGGITTYGIITVWTPFLFANGFVSVIPGGAGSGQVTSQPAGVDCTIANGSGSGACTSAFPVGTVVRLDARPAANSSFVGFRQTPGCFDASKIMVARGVTITCQVGFVLR
jgi:hypothetical protein